MLCIRTGGWVWAWERDMGEENRQRGAKLQDTRDTKDLFHGRGGKEEKKREEEGGGKRRQRDKKQEHQGCANTLTETFSSPILH